MINDTEYKRYLGVDTAPSNFDRLLYLSIQELRSIMVKNIPTSDDLTYNDFKKAVMEQVNFFDLNGDLIDSVAGSGASLGSYHEGSNSNSKIQDNKIEKIKFALDIIL